MRSSPCILKIFVKKHLNYKTTVLTFLDYVKLKNRRYRKTRFEKCYLIVFLTYLIMCPQRFAIAPIPNLPALSSYLFQSTNYLIKTHKKIYRQNQLTDTTIDHSFCFGVTRSSSSSYLILLIFPKLCSVHQHCCFLRSAESGKFF